MKKKVTLFILALCALALVLVWRPFGSRPLRGLAAADIQSAQVELCPPDVTYLLDREEIDRLVPLLDQVVIYRRDDSWRDYSGQLCRFTLTKTDGTVVTVMAYNPFLILDGVGYRTKYKPCQALNRFANTLRS